MLKIYGIKNCTSMKKAFTLLEELNLPYEFHDYKKQGIDSATLKNWLDILGQEAILNKKGTTWRKLSEAEQHYALSGESQLIEILTMHTSLIKRPVLAAQQGYLVGFNEAEYRCLLTG